MDDTTGGNIALMEHLNINTDMPEASFAFFLDGLGCAQDPRAGEAVEGKVYPNRTQWFNAGICQFHIPLTTRGSPGALSNVFSGRIGLQVPDLAELRKRLEGLEASGALSSTRFAWSEDEGGAAVAVTGPSGNTWLVTEGSQGARDVRGFHPGPVSWCLGLPFVEFDCPPGSAEGIARFYSGFLGAAARADGGVATVRTGPQQELRFVEAAGGAAGGEEYHLAERGIHLCVYVHDHAGPMERLRAEGLLWGNPRFRFLDEAQGQRQFRFKDLVDPLDEGRPRRVLLELEHEVRTLDHANSPFPHKEPHDLPSREPVPMLVSSVSSAWEQDFPAVRAEANAVSEGWIPPPVDARL